MTPTGYVLTSLESVLRRGVETVFYALLTLSVCALAIAAVAAVAPHVRRIFAARRQSVRYEVSAASARPGSSHASPRVQLRSRITSLSITAALTTAALVLVVAANGSRVASNAQTKAEAPPVVTIIATDYGYEAPDTVPAGLNVFRLVNHGDQMHAATIVRLEAGKTLPDYVEAYREANRTRGARPAWAKFRGGPAAVMHGEGNATVYLEPGNYAWVCFVPGPDGVSHLLEHNQAHAFVVRPRTENTPAPGAPEPSVSLRMVDYSFQLSAPLKVGRNVIRVYNTGADPHHVLLFKLTAGKTIQHFQAWLQKHMQGEAPCTYVGAMGELSTGAEAYLDVDLTAGEYVLVCLITGRDEVSHAAKGMIQQIRVS
jgi:hypothetical protein